jgi:uncharacterized protein
MPADAAQARIRMPLEAPPAASGFRWTPEQDTWIAALSYVAVVVALAVAFQVLTLAKVAAHFVMYGVVALAGLGVAFPALYTVLVRKRPLLDIGLTFGLVAPSLLLGALLGLDTYRNTVATLDITWSSSLVPLMAMTLAVGLFEAVFFRGWLQLRFEDAFGTVAGLILSALCYSLYHVGYGMGAGEMLFLFGYGLVFGAVFRLTSNVFVLWPFYTPVGSLYSNIKNGLELPFEATYGFVLVLVLITAATVAATMIYRKQAIRLAGAPTPSMDRGSSPG